jgi:hypothetical protein
MEINPGTPSGRKTLGQMTEREVIIAAINRAGTHKCAICRDKK